MQILVIISIVVLLAVIVTAAHGIKRKRTSGPKKNKKEDVELKRSARNPILRPRNDKDWEREATFNPAAIKVGDKTHLLYRAVGGDGVSRIGHAESQDGINFNERSDFPVFFMENPRRFHEPAAPHYDPVLNPSGGSWGGAEDPRIVNIDGTLYMTFNAFDGWDFIRIGLTSIKEKDFKEKKWSWSRTKLISPANQVNKNWVLFPEKIDGKFAILHSLSPSVQIDYVDSLDHLSSGAKKILSRFGQKAPRESWDTWVRGAGPPPLKTKDGWLVFYHAINKIDSHRYKLGMLLLDLKNPKKILARAKAPVLLPDRWYENEGKPGIVYACGAILEKEKVYVYYGGGDKYVCVAISPLQEIMDYLKKVGPEPHFDFKER